MHKTTHELTNRAIAELIGWTGIHEITYWLYDYYDESEITALAGRRPGGSDDDWLVPDFLHDANAALSLFGAGSPLIVLRSTLVGNQWAAGLLHSVTLDGVTITIHGKWYEAKTPALAVCLVFLAYRAALALDEPPKEGASPPEGRA